MKAAEEEDSGASVQWRVDPERRTVGLRDIAHMRPECPLSAEPHAPKYFHGRPWIEYLARSPAKGHGDPVGIGQGLAGMVRVHRNRAPAEAAPVDLKQGRNQSGHLPSNRTKVSQTRTAIELSNAATGYIHGQARANQLGLRPGSYRDQGSRLDWTNLLPTARNNRALYSK